MSPRAGDELAPRPGDPIIDKNRYDAVLYAEPEVVLGALGAKRLVTIGVVTNMCVECTVRATDLREFDVYVASDGTA